MAQPPQRPPPLMKGSPVATRISEELLVDPIIQPDYGLPDVQRVAIDPFGRPVSPNNTTPARTRDVAVAHPALYSQRDPVSMTAREKQQRYFKRVATSMFVDDGSSQTDKFSEAVASGQPVGLFGLVDLPNVPMPPLPPKSPAPGKTRFFQEGDDLYSTFQLVPGDLIPLPSVPPSQPSAQAAQVHSPTPQSPTVLQPLSSVSLYLAPSPALPPNHQLVGAPAPPTSSASCLASPLLTPPSPSLNDPPSPLQSPPSPLAEAQQHPAFKVLTTVEAEAYLAPLPVGSLLLRLMNKAKEQPTLVVSFMSNAGVKHSVVEYLAGPGWVVRAKTSAFWTPVELESSFRSLSGLLAMIRHKLITAPTAGSPVASPCPTISSPPLARSPPARATSPLPAVASYNELLVQQGSHNRPLTPTQEHLSPAEQELVRAAVAAAPGDRHLPFLCTAVRLCLGKAFSVEPWLAGRPDWDQPLRARDLLTDSPNYFDQPHYSLLTAPLKEKYKITKKETTKGGFARVFRGKLRDAKKNALTVLTNAGNDSLVAVKVLEVGTADQEAMALREIATLASHRHANLLTFYEAYRHGSTFSIVTEFLEGGTLHDAAKSKSGVRFSEPQLAHIAQAVLRGLRFLHEQELLHRDIKGQNVMLSALGAVKLIDCGLVCHLADLPARRRLCGSPFYLAPEMVRGQLQGPPVDVWCTGLTLAELANQPGHSKPQAGAILRSIFQHSLEGVPKPLQQPDQWSPLCLDFLRACLRLHPADRPSVRHCLKHAWLERASTAQDLGRTVARMFLASTVQLSGF